MEGLEKSIRYVKGVGERIGALLSRKNIYTVEDALYFFPRTYEDRREVLRISKLELGNFACVLGKIHSAHPVHHFRSRRKSFEIILEDLEKPQKQLVLKYFYRPYKTERYEKGLYVCATGKVTSYRGELQMVHPDLEILGRRYESDWESPGILPIYSQTEGLFQKTLRRIEARVVEEYANRVPEVLPKTLMEKYQFPSISKALEFLHRPQRTSHFEKLISGETKAHERLIYEEFFILSCFLAQQRRGFVEKPGISFSKPEKEWEVLKNNLGFRFTNAQRRVLKEIFEDMSTDRVMCRMVQGDVGSGKTAVSAAAALIALHSGCQVAFMAPTEVLVDQHLAKFQEWFEGLGFPVLKLTGSMKAAEKRTLYEQLESETPLIVLGTHALFEEQVRFGKLGFVVVDEQHRFGVRQRAQLLAKGKSPDLLVMTATPIPRTLALTVYGDLDLSVIDELPPGRKEIQTKIYTEKQRELLNKFLEQEIKKGAQVYVIFPLIENSEKLSLKSLQEFAPGLQKRFKDISVEILHGRLDAIIKREIIERFRNGETKILLSTTVVEVGVDVPNATIMVVENAERFGLSQLHQLRGRVGRGEKKSYCFLVPSHLGTEDIIKRLRTMEKTQDGFRLAEVDLEMRGPGEFLGTKQAGLPEFRLGQLPRDYEILKRSRNDAFSLLKSDPDLSSEPRLKDYLERQASKIHLG